MLRTLAILVIVEEINFAIQQVLPLAMTLQVWSG